MCVYIIVYIKIINRHNAWVLGRGAFGWQSDNDKKVACEIKYTYVDTYTRTPETHKRSYLVMVFYVPNVAHKRYKDLSDRWLNTNNWSDRWCYVAYASCKPNHCYTHTLSHQEQRQINDPVASSLVVYVTLKRVFRLWMKVMLQVCVFTKPSSYLTTKTLTTPSTRMMMGATKRHGCCCSWLRLTCCSTRCWCL